MLRVKRVLLLIEHACETPRDSVHESRKELHVTRHDARESGCEGTCTGVERPLHMRALPAMHAKSLLTE